MQGFQGSGGPGQGDQHLLQEGQQQQQPWSGQVQQGFEHPGLLQLQQQFHHQQQMQHQLMLGAGHANLAPLVGQQISQLSSLVGGHAGSQQSPPGLGHNSLNVMLAQQQHGQQVMFPGAPLHQSPPSSSGGFLLLPGGGQQRPGDSGGSPNSTPGLQTPTPAATPPIMNLGGVGLEERGGLFLQQGGGRMMLGQHDLPQELAQADFGEQMMAWRGLQALSGGTLADMFPPMDRGMGMGMGGPGGQAGFNNFTMAMAQAAQAQQAQENMMRLQQAGEFGGHSKQFPLPGGQFQQQFQPREFQPPPHMAPPHSQDMGRPYQQAQGNWQQAQPTQSPPPGSFSLPPGPRPRPVGGDSSPPGFHPDTMAGPPKEEQLVIGSWNDECEKETPAAPEKRDPMVLDMSLPPPGHDPRAGEWGGNFQAGRRGSGRPWQTDPAPEESNRWGGGREPKAERGRGGFEPRGRGRGGRGGRGGYMENREQRPNVDIVQEKADGKNSAIEETKAMMLKMRLEEKAMTNKFRKEKGLPELEDTDKSANFRPRERRGRDDRKDGMRGQRGGGRGTRGARGGLPPPGPVPMPPQMMGGPMGGMGGMGPFVPGDFRTPPFPGLEGFFPPPGFPHNFAPGFPPGMLPGGFPGDMMRGRGGFPRGGRGGPPAGFPPRGLAPPFIGGRGAGRGGRGGRGGPQGAFGREDNCFMGGEEKGEGDEEEGHAEEVEQHQQVVEEIEQQQQLLQGQGVAEVEQEKEGEVVDKVTEE